MVQVKAPLAQARVAELAQLAVEVIGEVVQSDHQVGQPQPTKVVHRQVTKEHDPDRPDRSQRGHERRAQTRGTRATVVTDDARGASDSIKPGVEQSEPQDRKRKEVRARETGERRWRSLLRRSLDFRGQSPAPRDRIHINAPYGSASLHPMLYAPPHPR